MVDNMKKLLLLLFALLSCKAVADDIAPSGPTGLVFPDNWQSMASWDNTQPNANLPARFNWNDFMRLQPIRNQGSCGSCWAFSVTAVTESLHRILYPMLFPIVDLAEQTLVSTCERGGDCGGGFFDAFDYIKGSGLPKEADDPYRARNSSCQSGLTPFAKITGWSYVGDENRGPTIEQIKQAVYDHGPVSIDINGSLSNTASVIKSCGSTMTNHMVNVEGWVDDPDYADYGGGYWIIRNSWGKDWGDHGYFKIVYKSRGGSKCNGAGSTAAYAIMNNVQNIREYLGL